jgi:hypothetical protein
MAHGENTQSALNLVPFVSQLLLEAPQLAATIGNAFVTNGGTEEEYGIIREHARELASKLGHPDTYFDPPKPSEH